MKEMGIVRRIDDLGRVVIPKETRRTMRIREGERLPEVRIYGSHTPGDINGDGVDNNKDPTRLFQYLSDWDVEIFR